MDCNKNKRREKKNVLIKADGHPKRHFLKRCKCDGMAITSWIKQMC